MKNPFLKIKSILLITFIALLNPVSHNSYSKPAHDGPNLINKLSITVYIAYDKQTYLYSTILKYKNEILYLISEPVLKNDDYEYVKIIKNPEYEDEFSFVIKLKDPHKLKIITKDFYSKRLAFYINEKIASVPKAYAAVSEGFIQFGNFGKNEMIKLIGKETFEIYNNLLEY